MEFRLPSSSITISLYQNTRLSSSRKPRERNKREMEKGFRFQTSRLVIARKRINPGPRKDPGRGRRKEKRAMTSIVPRVST